MMHKRRGKKKEKKDTYHKIQKMRHRQLILKKRLILNVEVYEKELRIIKHLDISLRGLASLPK